MLPFNERRLERPEVGGLLQQPYLLLDLDRAAEGVVWLVLYSEFKRPPAFTQNAEAFRPRVVAFYGKLGDGTFTLSMLGNPSLSSSLPLAKAIRAPSPAKPPITHGQGELPEAPAADVVAGAVLVG